MTAGLSSRRALWRLAVRDLRRHRGQSWLVLALVALPVAAMVAGMTLLATTQGTAEDQAMARMGRADVVVFDANEPARPRSELRALLPADAEVAAVGQDAAGMLRAGGGRTEVEVVGADLDGILAGTFTLVDGRVPTATDEVVVSTPVVADLGITIGDTVQVDPLGPTTVVGEVLDTDRRAGRVVVTGAGDVATVGEWAVAVPPGTDVDTGRLVDAGFATLARADAAAAPTTSEANLVLVLGGFGLLEAGMVVAAAFAVSVRRRQRELGLLAAGGGVPRQLRTLVRLSGIALGMVGAVLGAAVGLAGSWAALPFLQARADRVVAGLVVSSGRVVVAMVLGLVTAVVAAAVPARGAIRLPVVTALAGRRPTPGPSRRSAVLGVVLVLAGVGVVVLGTVLLSTGSMPEWVGQTGAPAIVLLGSSLGVLGFGAASPWLLERLGRVAPRLPLGLRLAVRDTGRFRTRNGPVITAVIAGLAGSVALGTALGSFEARDRAAWQPQLEPDQVAVFGPRAASVAHQVADRLGAVATGELRLPELGKGGFFDGFLDVQPGTASGGPRAVEAPSVTAVVGDAATVRALGGGDAAVAALQRGEAVVWSDVAPVTVEAVGLEGDGGGGPVDLGPIPAHVVARTGRPTLLPDAVISPVTMRRLGIADRTGSQDLAIVRLPGTVSPDQEAVARQVAAGSVSSSVVVERGYVSTTAALRTGAVVAALVTGMVVVAIALALAAAEARDDQRTLVAVGAAPRARRDLAAGRALVLAGLGGLLAVPAGLLPAWGVLTIIPTVEMTLVWPPIVAAAVVLPLVAVAGAWLLTRPTPAWSPHRVAP